MVGAVLSDSSMKIFFPLYFVSRLWWRSRCCGNGDSGGDTLVGLVDRSDRFFEIKQVYRPYIRKELDLFVDTFVFL